MSGTTVEHVKDAAPVFGKYFDILAIRTFPSLKNREDDYSELYIKQIIKSVSYTHLDVYKRQTWICTEDML